MSFETLSPEAAARRLKESGGRYVDVRSVPEFEAGHPEGALNVPIAHLSGAGMEANADFLPVMERRFRKDEPLFVGCKMGGRSARACELLAEAGWSNLVNVDGGFAGRPGGGDASIQKGWSGSGLPTSTEPAPGATWEELRGGA